MHTPNDMSPHHCRHHPQRQRQRRFPFRPAKRAQRLCRHLLNVAGSFYAALDSHDTRSCPLLIPVSSELDAVGAQLKACLLGLTGIVKNVAPVRRCDGCPLFCYGVFLAVCVCVCVCGGGDGLKGRGGMV